MQLVISAIIILHDGLLIVNPDGETYIKSSLKITVTFVLNKINNLTKK